MLKFRLHDDVFAPYFAPYEKLGSCFPCNYGLSENCESVCILSVQLMQFVRCCYQETPCDQVKWIDTAMNPCYNGIQQGEPPSDYCEWSRKERETMATSSKVICMECSVSPLFVTILQAQEILQLSRTTIYRLRDEGKLMFVHEGRKVLIPTTSLSQYAQLKVDTAAMHRLQNPGRWS